MTTAILPGRGREITRGLLAAACLLVLLIGLPLLLIHTGGGLPLRTGLPSLTSLGHRLSAPDDGHVLVDVLLICGWTGWLVFTGGVGAEIVALRRGRFTATLPFSGVQQLAARLVTAVALLLPAAHTPLLAVTAAAAASPLSFTAQQPIHPDSLAVAAIAGTTSNTTRTPSPPSATPALQQPAEKLYTVAQPHDRQRDTLWSIAARHLGDPLRWQQIFQLNQHRAQPDGRTLTDPALIRVGWQLLMPADATDLPASPADTAAPSATRQPAPHQSATHQPAPRQPTPTAEPTTPAELTVPTPILAPPPSQAELNTNSVAPEQKSVPTPVISDPSAPAREHDEHTVRIAAEIGGALISVLLAAGFLRNLNVRRRLQRRRRSDGHTIPTPTRKLAATETQLRIAADHDLAAQLDSALRRMTLDQRASTASDLGYRIGRVTPAGLQLSAPVNYDRDSGERHRSSEEPTTVSLDDEATPDAPALLPLLLPVGRIEEHTLLLDLERIGDLALLGESHILDEAFASILTETLTAPWSDTTRITVICRRAALAPALMEIVAAHTDRITLLTEMTAQFFGGLEHETRGLSRPRPSVTTDPVVASRINSRGEPHPAHLIMMVDPLPAHELRQLQELQTRLPRPAFTLLQMNPTSTATTSELHVTRDTARLTPDLVEFIPYRITSQLAQDLRELLDLTERPADLPNAVVAHLPAEHERNTPDAAGTPPDGHDALQDTDPRPVDATDVFDPTLDADLAAYHDPSRTDIVRVCLLGPPTVTAPGPLAANRRATCTEIVMYLATHPRGVDVSDLETAIWPHGVKASTRHQALARTRAWLGSTSQGEPNLPAISGGQLQLAPTVLVDWELFTRLLRRAERRPKNRAGDLRAALNLAQGKPLENLTPGRYSWLAENLLEQHLPSAVVDAAHHLAELLLDEGDITGAQQVAQTALMVDQFDERTWRDLMRAAAAAGNLLGVTKLRDQLTQLLGDDNEDDLAPETLELLSELAPRKRAVND